ncbi:unnamed protein product [Caenorhabditis sp. 36 PRJEB53466]|nr:unnamed protein product [Caenorhabditis sp. 36 PRJEB53466]
MPEEYIMSSKACVYVLGGSANVAALYDFDGVYILDGGFAEKATGFVAHVRNVSAVLLSAPTKNNLGTTSALLEQDKPLPVFTNTKPLKSAQSGTSGEQVKLIQEANSKLLSVPPPLFSPKYQPQIIYQSAAKGVLSLYVLAGDSKDGEAITKALASGNEGEVEKAAAVHGTIAVLLWRPAQGDQPAVRVLISGTSSVARIQQSLDRAAKFLPFLNAPVVKSKDALNEIPAPAVPRATAPSKPLVKPTSSANRPAPAPVRAPIRPASTGAARAIRSGPTAKAPAPAPARTRPAPASNGAPARKTVAPTTRAAPSASSHEPIAAVKTVGKAQGAAPSKAAAAKKAPVAAAPHKKQSPPSSVDSAPAAAAVVAPKVVVDLDDSVICLSDLNQESSGSNKPFDIVVIPPTPEPPRSEEVFTTEEEPKQPVVDVEPEIPPPVDAFKKPKPEPEPASSGSVEPEPVAPEIEKPKEPASPKAHEKPAPVYPTLDDVTLAPSLIDVDPIQPAHPEPSAPVIPADHVTIATDDPTLPDVAVAVPFVPHVPGGKDDGLIALDDDVQHVAPGFEEPLIPQAPREDGTLADCSEEVSQKKEISMDTDKTGTDVDISAPVGEITWISSEFQNLGLDDKTEEYVRKISNQMIEDATLPFTSALASSIVGGDVIAVKPDSEKPLLDFGTNGNGTAEDPKDTSKHDLMQSRSSIIENGAAVDYEKADPAIDEILAACAIESEKVDAASTPNTPKTVNTLPLFMPAATGVPFAKPVKFARPYYFDVVTVPHNAKLETTLNEDGLHEFVSKVRARNLVLPSKDISSDQLSSIMTGKQTWCESAHPCTIIPTHTSPMLLEFRQKHEPNFQTVHLSLAVPVEKQRTTVSSEAGAVEYELARIALE